MRAAANHAGPVFEVDKLEEHLLALSDDLPMAHFGLRALDLILGGVHPGLLYTLGTGPGKGKTTLALQEADKLAADGHPVIFVSAELPQHKLLEKSIARLSRGELPLSEVAAASSPDHPEHGAFTSALAMYRDLIAPNMCITGGLNMAELGRLVGACINDRGQTPIVFLDYLQLIACGTSSEPILDERLAIASCVASLRDIASSYNVPIIALSSTTRGSYNSQKPDLGIFGGSSAVEYSFDAALYLADDTDKPDSSFNLPVGTPLKLVALKNRYGTLGTMKLDFDGKHACFHDLA